MRNCKIEAPGCIALALGALALPLRWFLGAVLAAGFHEFCHYAAARGMGCRMHILQAGWGGARMDVSPMSAREELVCAAAGPVGSLALSMFLRQFPELAIMGLCQGVFNLLPLFPLDGGRIVKCIFGEKAATWIHTCAWFILFFTAIQLLFWIPGAGCLILAFLFSGKVRHPGKSSCKESIQAVQ